MGTTTITTTKHILNRHKQSVPKGCLAVKVGEASGEQQRFVVPVTWFNHPLFMQLLKEAEDEYGFEQKGTITIPCNVHTFCTVISRIGHNNRDQHVGCFRVWAV
ncbi:small auxin-up RNA [Artemisia annua]|uniref:Small auxin-up RNA n=1 Tax=Artemisia annua TaxID=35608 RepID=A0A2U1P570_ARTAN|nr:small auxin-up RNA [Artemisia annua]